MNQALMQKRSLSPSINTNDRTVEGLKHRDLDIMSVQYHPEAHPGPLDTEKIFFDRVVETTKKIKVMVK